MKKLCCWSCGLFLVVTLFGCSGGGGGGSGGLTTNLFIDWPSVDPPENVALTGISQDADYAADPDSTPPFLTSAITDIYPVSTDLVARIKYRADESIERIEIVTENLDNVLVWDDAADDIIDYTDGDPWVIAKTEVSNPAALGILFNPREMDPAEAWEYQTFGAWATGRGLGSGAIGAMTVGTPTSSDALQLLELPSPDVTFSGHAAGIYIDSSGTDYRTQGDLTVVVNFGNTSLDLSTENTVKIDLGTGATSPGPEIGGLLSYDSDVNSFTGEVFGPGLSGNSTGQFYGPAAEELGGVFSLSGASSPEYYSGAYGARQEPSVP